MFPKTSQTRSRLKLALQPLEERTQPAALPSLRVALISNAVEQASALQASANANVIALTYDAQTATLDSLVDQLQSLSANAGGAKISHLGLVAHGQAGSITLGDLDTLNRADTAKASSTWTDLRQLLTPTARLDLYSCNVAAGATGRAFVQALARRTGADVYASTDAVGNGIGADWTWEYSTAVNSRSSLFNTAMLQTVAGLRLEDVYAPNQVKANADRPTGANSPNLGVVTGNKTIANLQLVANQEDWFRFETQGIGTVNDSVRLQFTNANGNIDLYLYAEDGTTQLDYSTSNSDVEQVQLAGLPKGIYYILVYPRSTDEGNPNYTLQVTAPAAAPDDLFEPNDGKSAADVPTGANSPNFGLLTGIHNVANLMLDGESDWFKFTTDGVSTADHYVRLDFLTANGNIDLYLYEQDGSTIFDSSTSNNDAEIVQLAGKPAGTYYIQVYPRNGSNTGNGNYSLQIVAPPAAPDDVYEPNDGKIDADRNVGVNSPNLGPVAGTLNISDLVLDGESDWFKFQTTQASTTGNYVRLDFLTADGNVDLYVYEQNGTTQVGSSTSNGDAEQVSLASKPAGTYYIQVYPRNGSVTGNHKYSLQILAPGSGLGISPVNVVEGDGGSAVASFTVSRSDGAGSASVNYSTSDGTAEAGSDYQATSGTLNFANGELSKTINVPIIGDHRDESDETFFMNLSGAVGGLLNNTYAVGTITDDDDGGVIEFGAPTYTVNEGIASVSVKVVRTGGADGQASVDYTTDDASANAPGDYTAKSGTITFNSGEITKTIVIPIINDSETEAAETFNLFLANVDGAVLGNLNSSEVLIPANDLKPGTFVFSSATFVASEGSGRALITVDRVGGDNGPVSVKYATANRTALAKRDYTAETGILTFADGETSQTFEIELLNDVAFERNETFVVTLSAPTGGAKLGTPRTATVTIENDDHLVNSRAVVIGGGTGNQVKVMDGPTGAIKMTINAFPTGFKAGVRVATGDVTGDGIDDIICAPGPNGSTTIRVFDGSNGLKVMGTMGEFFHGLGTAGGINVAVGDVNGDGRADIIASSGSGSSNVRIFDGMDRSLLGNFEAFGGAASGVNVAVGDVVGDGNAEIIVAPGVGGTGDIKLFSFDGNLLKSYAGFSGGVNVAAGDLDGDGKADLIVGSQPGAGPHIKIIKGTDETLLGEIVPYPASFLGGVRVAVGDVDGDGFYDLIVAPGAGNAQKMKFYHTGSLLPIRQLSPLGSTYRSGMFVAGGRLS